jgi:hypothetical protein
VSARYFFLLSNYIYLYLYLSVYISIDRYILTHLTPIKTYMGSTNTVWETKAQQSEAGSYSHIASD